MNSKSKTKEELIIELHELRDKYKILESSYEINQGEWETEKIIQEKLLQSSKEMIQYHSGDPDFQRMAELMLEMSGAKYLALNIFDDNGMDFTTLSIAGIKENFEKGFRMLGFELKNKHWKHDPVRAKKTNAQTITHFSHLHELTGDTISRNVIQLLEKTFQLGEVCVIKVEKENKLLGDFTLIFNKGETLKNANFCELYANQVGMFLDRYKIADHAVANENMIRAITDAAQDAIMMMDPEGKISYWNPAAENILGYTNAEAMGKNLHKLLMPRRYAEAHHAAFPIFQKTGMGAAIGEIVDLEAIRKDGKEISVQLSLSAVYFSNAWHAVGIIRDVSQQKRVEMELNASKLHYQAIFNESPLGIAVVDSQSGHIYEVNPQFAKISGRTMEDLAKIDWMQITHPDDVQENLGNMALLNAGQISGFNMEKRYLKPDGTHVWINMTVAPVLIDRNEGARHLSMIEDITERKANEETLRNLSKAVEQSPVSIVITDIDGNIEYGNPKVFKLTGYSAEELVGQNPSIFKTDHTSKKEYAKLWNTIKSGQIWQGEFLNKKKNGELYWESALISPITNKAGRIVHFLAIKEDITERKRVEKEVRESENRFHSLFDNMAEGVALHELVYKGNVPVNYRIVDVNQQFIDATGVSREQVVGKLCTEAYGTVTPPYFDEYVKVSTSKIPLSFETWFEGMKKQFAISVAPWKENGFATIFMDITDRKQAEEKIRQNNEALTKLVAEKDKFFSIISHDLKSPFNGIMGFSQLLVEQINEKDYDGIEKYAEIIQQSSEQAMDLLMNLMDWSRSQTGRMEFNPENLEMIGLISEVSLFFELIAGQKSISIVKNLPSKANIFADKAMISTVMRNLISNAIKFTNPGGEIVISLEVSQNAFTVSVADNGLGIPASEIDKLFRIDEDYSTLGTQKEKGTGLGLILCKEFVEKHNGKIWVESEEGEGSTFSFTLPSITK